MRRWTTRRSNGAYCRTGAHRIPAPQHCCERPASRHRYAFVAFCLSGKPRHGVPRRVCTGFTGRPQIVGFLAPGTGRHAFRRLGATQGDCDGSDRVYVDSGNRRRFVRTLSGLLVKGPGFDTSSLISFGIKPALNGYSGAEESRLIRRITEGLRDSSSIQASAVAHDQLLLGGAWSNSLPIQAGERYITDRADQMNAVSPGLFATLGARIVAGRDFNEHDALNVIAPNQSMPVSQTGQRAVIVNEAFVKRYFGGRNPLGARVAMGSAPDAKPDSEIVGVVESISYRNVREQWEQAYFPTGTEMSGSNFYVRFRGTPESAFRSIRAILRNADPTLPISYFRTLDEQIDRSLNTERMLAELSSSFVTLALLLS